MSFPGGFKSDDIRNWWDKQARNHPESAGILALFGTDRCSLLYRQLAEWNHFCRLVSFRQTLRVLELGCGAGRWALLMAPLVQSVVAVDFSSEMIALAKNRAESAGVRNVRFIIGTAQDFLLPECYDVIYLSGVDQYLDDTSLRATISHAAAMLAQNGILIDRVTISTGARFVCDQTGGYQCIYRTLAELESAFASEGFEMRYHAPSHYPLRLTRLTRWRPVAFMLQALLERSPRVGCCLLETITGLIQAIRPRVGKLTDRSHDFFVMRRKLSGAEVCGMPVLPATVER